MTINRGLAPVDAVPMAGNDGYRGAPSVQKGQGPMPGNPMATAKGWHPTVANLLVLIVLELLAFAALRRVFRVMQG